MIKAGANLGKVNLRIFHNGIEYTDKETSNLDELFPNLQKMQTKKALLRPISLS
jgi:hypothetical protein